MPTKKQLPFASPPARLCILRLSAIGDVTHVVPIVRTLQKTWPRTHITWIIGKLEAGLVSDITGVEFILYDKSGGISAYLEIWKVLRQRRFDILLHMQMSLRASLISLLVRAPIRLGFDFQRAKDLQWVFTNHKINPVSHQHVLDSFCEFLKAMGIHERVLQWKIPLTAEVQDWAAALLKDRLPALVISPCSVHAYRNWSIEGYAAVAQYAHNTHGMHIVLTGGPSEMENSVGDAIVENLDFPVTNLIGKTSLKQLLAVVAGATVIISPDSGPAHMATAVGIPVIGLYASTNPNRARPYLSHQWTVNKYPQALLREYGISEQQAQWGTRIRSKHAMQAIKTHDVCTMLDRVLEEINPTTERYS